MTRKDLEKVLPASNAKDDDDEYELVNGNKDDSNDDEYYSDSDDSEDESDDSNAKTSKSDSSKDAKKSKSKKTRHSTKVSDKPVIKTKQTKLPTRKNLASANNNALQPNDPIKKVYEKHEPLFTQQYKVKLANEAITDKNALKEGFDDNDNANDNDGGFKAWIKKPLNIVIVVVAIIIFLCVVGGIYYYCKRKFTLSNDPVNDVVNDTDNESTSKPSSMKGGNKGKDAKDLHTLTSETYHNNKLPPGFEDSYYAETEEDVKRDARAEAMMKDKVPISKIVIKKGDIKKNNTKEPLKRDSRGRFLKRK